jgi:hypothetical protein
MYFCCGLILISLAHWKVRMRSHPQPYLGNWRLRLIPAFSNDFGLLI